MAANTCELPPRIIETSTRFFLSPTVWSVLTTGVSTAVGYSDNLNAVSLISSFGGTMSYFGAGAASLHNHADYATYEEKIRRSMDILHKLNAEREEVTVLDSYAPQNNPADDGYYLYRENSTINVLIIREQDVFLKFPFRDLEPSENFILQLLDWEDIIGSQTIQGNLGKILAYLIEIHSEHLNQNIQEITEPQQDEQSMLNRLWNRFRNEVSHCYSGLNKKSGATVLFQVVALALCLFETVQYSRNLASDVPDEYDPSNDYLFAAVLMKTFSTLSYEFSNKYLEAGEKLLEKELSDKKEDYQKKKQEKKKSLKAIFPLFEPYMSQIQTLNGLKDKLVKNLRELSEGKGEYGSRLTDPYAGTQEGELFEQIQEQIPEISEIKAIIFLLDRFFEDIIEAVYTIDPHSKYPTEHCLYVRNDFDVFKEISRVLQDRCNLKDVVETYLNSLNRAIETAKTLIIFTAKNFLEKQALSKAPERSSANHSARTITLGI